MALLRGPPSFWNPAIIGPLLSALSVQSVDVGKNIPPVKTNTNKDKRMRAI